MSLKLEFDESENIWDELQTFMNEHITEIQFQKKGYIDTLYQQAITRFGERIPAKSVFKCFIAFYRSFHNIDKQYCPNKYYAPSPRKHRATTPPVETPN
jgi:hypothetical protein